MEKLDEKDKSKKAHDLECFPFRTRRVDPVKDTFDPKDPKIKQDIISMIVQYLHQEGYTSSAMILQDEAKVKLHEQLSRQIKLKRLRKAILEGDWVEVEKACNKETLKSYFKTLIYAVYKQQYLEMIDRQEYQKAFTFLNKRLKPFESMKSSPQEFGDLCYLLTCKSVQEAASFRDWQGVMTSRENLVERFDQVLGLDNPLDLARDVEKEAPPQRLMQLLQQSVAYQLEFSRYHPKAAPKIRTLLEDYRSLIIPNQMKLSFRGHLSNIKSVDFVGENGQHIVSGSSDKTLRFWETETGKCLGIMVGHKARIWDVSAPPNGSFLVSGSGDSTIKLWSTQQFTSLDNNLTPQSTLLQSVARALSRGVTETSFISSIHSNGGTTPITDFNLDEDAGEESTEDEGDEEMEDKELKKFTAEATLTGHQGDVYTVAVHPSGTMISSGGYDTTIRLYDIKTQKVCRTLLGHSSSVCSAVFNPLGNLIITGSKDNSIKFWDVVSGACVKTFSYHLGEVTSVETNSSGTLLLSSSKDNSNRVWDIRSAKPLVRLKGHQNTSKNFIKSSFGPSQQLIVGGSEDGCVYIWDVDHGTLLQKLQNAHNGIVYNVRWHPVAELLLSCSHDGTAKTWWYDPSQGVE